MASTPPHHSTPKPVLACFAVALASLLATGAVATEPASPPDQILARVDLAGPASDLGVPVYAVLRGAAGREYAVVITSPSTLAWLGPQATVLEVPASVGSYLVARVRLADARRSLPVSVTLLHDDGLNLLLRATPADSDALAAGGLDLAWLPQEPVAWTPGDAAPVVKAVVYNPDIAALIDLVQESAVSDWVSGLSGETSVVVEGSPYTITTRHTSSGTPATTRRSGTRATRGSWPSKTTAPTSTPNTTP
ncbi:MAG TPA: hypothetical protein VJU18_17745 [Vicinamibacteria bacterium]|nr:hypothetical protein [Vicinamibacteria bacterium]